MVDILRLQTHDQGEMKSAHSWPVKIIDFRSLRQRETNFAGNRRASGVKTFQLPKWGANPRSIRAEWTAIEHTEMSGITPAGGARERMLLSARDD
jgi:hypothetical protein